MPSTDRKTRQQIRQAIGIALGAVDMDAGAITHSPSEAAPSAGKIIDNALAFGAENEHRGKWVLATDAGSSVQVRRVSASSPDERSLTVSVPFDAAPSTAWTFELWDADVSPIMVHQFINDALSEVTRKGSVNVIGSSFHFGGKQNEFDLSANSSVSALWTGVKEVQWRARYKGEPATSFDDAMSSLTSGVTISTDSANRREGAAAAKLAVDSATSTATALAELAFPAIDARAYDRFELWIATNVPITSSAFAVQIMDGVVSRGIFGFPASITDSWLLHTAGIGAPEQNSAITSIRFRTGSSAQSAAVTVWLDDARFFSRLTETWQTIPRDFWTIDQANRRVVVKDEFVQPYAKVQIWGVRAPNQLTADSAVSEIDAQYVVNSVIAKVLRANADRRGSDADAAAKRAVGYEQLAQAQRIRWSMPSGVRWLED